MNSADSFSVEAVDSRLEEEDIMHLTMKIRIAGASYQFSWHGFNLQRFAGVLRFAEQDIEADPMIQWRASLGRKSIYACWNEKRFSCIKPENWMKDHKGAGEELIVRLIAIAASQSKAFNNFLNSESFIRFYI